LVAGVVATCVGGAAALPVLTDSSSSHSLVKVTAAEGTPVPGQYIVTLKKGASISSTAKKVKATGAESFDGVLNGFVARLTGTQLDKLRHDGRVAAIEQDQIITTQGYTQKSAPWGLDRIDQRKRPLSKTYHYNALAKNVTAYVIDTGLAVKDTQFGGRAKVVWAAGRFKGNGADCNGHGTHVAGIIGSATYGVAKGVNLRALRVLDCNGQGYVSDMVAAAKWLRAHAAKPSVANISVGGPRSAALNTAVTNLSKSGVFVSVSAGNDNKDACNFSPSSAGWTMTVGATTADDKRASFSNWGKCVDITAPGNGIWSTYLNNQVAKMSGTSMATPFVSGVAALYLQTHPRATFPQVQKWLNDNSTKNVISGLRGQANRLLYKSNL
jgi:subtilisin family serine protease